MKSDELTLHASCLWVNAAAIAFFRWHEWLKPEGILVLVGIITQLLLLARHCCVL